MADIDFSNTDSRMNYLKENLGHLMGGIDKNYGQVLMDELMNRLEKTVSDFNEEVKAMLAQLQGFKNTPRDNIMKSASSRPVPSPGPAPLPSPFSSPHEPGPIRPLHEVEIEVQGGLSEFEKRLQSLDK